MLPRLTINAHAGAKSTQISLLYTSHLLDIVLSNSESFHTPIVEATSGEMASLLNAPALDLDRRADRAGLPLYPARRVVNDALLRGLQYGAAAGLLAAPLWSLSRAKPLGRVFHRVMVTTSAAGAVASAGHLYYRLWAGELDTARVDAEAARIARDEGIKAYNNMMLVASAAGASYGAIFGTMGLRSVAAGSLTAVALIVAADQASKQLGAGGLLGPAPAQADRGSSAAPQLR